MIKIKCLAEHAYEEVKMRETVIAIKNDCFPACVALCERLQSLAAPNILRWMK